MIPPRPIHRSNPGSAPLTDRAWILAAALFLMISAPSVDAQHYLATSDSLHPRLKFADSIDSATRVVIGHDVFYFSDRASRARFLRNPLRYCRRLTDPVTLARFAPARNCPRLTYHGRPYYFSRDSTLALFKATPDRFAVRRGM